MLYNFKNNTPILDSSVFVAPNATVIGDVTIGEASGIWFGSVVRGDVHSIRIGDHSNVQDLCMLHVTGGKYALNIGNHCTLGHNVTVHGCTLLDHAFIGMGAMVMDGATIGEFALVAAGAMVTPGKMIPPRMVAMGSPAKVVREITVEEEQMILNIPLKYAQLAQEYKDQNSFIESN